jgi:hypothetical protein
MPAFWLLTTPLLPQNSPERVVTDLGIMCLGAVMVDK